MDLRSIGTYSLRSVAGGSLNTILMAGMAAARAVSIINGKDIARACQSTLYKKVQPKDC